MRDIKNALNQVNKIFSSFSLQLDIKFSGITSYMILRCGVSCLFRLNRDDDFSSIPLQKLKVTTRNRDGAQ